MCHKNEKTFKSNMVLGDAVSKLETFLFNNVSRAKTW